jgi:hypothetical protein
MSRDLKHISHCGQILFEAILMYMFIEVRANQMSVSKRRRVIMSPLRNSNAYFPHRVLHKVDKTESRERGCLQRKSMIATGKC